MLIDSVTITVNAGDGGNGGSTLSRTAQTSKGGPDGGNGGNGGSIYAQGSNNIKDLYEFRYKKTITAENGVQGSKGNKFGKNASDLIIKLPIGTRITNLDTGNVREIVDSTNQILIVKGGVGGLGNVEFKSATNQTPLHGTPGAKGQIKRLLLDLRLIAEIGLIGLPNAGKSSLLQVLTHAHPKIGNYPFTTLDPNIGMFGPHPIADIPGLIEGASKGKGLGITFLKHIEKTKILVHCVDITSNDPLKDYTTVRKEFGLYNELLLQKPEIILLTKTDMVDEETVTQYKKLFQKMIEGKVFSYSLYDHASIIEFKKLLETTLGQ